MAADVLTYPERAELDQLEAAIDAGLPAFDRVYAVIEGIAEKDWVAALKTAGAFVRIHDGGLHRPESWHHYCLRRFTYTPRTIDRRLAVFRVLLNVSGVVRHMCPDRTPWVPGVRHAQAVADLPAQEQREVVERALDESPRPTAARLRELAAKAKAALAGLADPRPDVTFCPGAADPAPATDPDLTVDVTSPQGRKQAARDRQRKAGKPEVLTAIGRCVVRAEWLSGKLEATDRDRLIASLAVVREALTAAGPWPWQAKPPVVTVFRDGRTPEDRRAERERQQARHPDHHERERRRKKAERERKRAARGARN